MCEKKAPAIITTVQLDIKGKVISLTLDECRELQDQLSEVARATTPHYVPIGGSPCQINWRNNPNFAHSWSFMGT